MDSKSGVVVLLIDLSAAFDTVDHQVLLKILHDDIGVRGIALKWFHSFLTGRSQRVQVGTSRSEPLDIIFGVPQFFILLNLEIMFLKAQCSSRLSVGPCLVQYLLKIPFICV